MAKCSAASSFAVYIYFQLFRVLRFISRNRVLPTSYHSTLVPAVRLLSWNTYRSLSECISYVFLSECVPVLLVRDAEYWKRRRKRSCVPTCQAVGAVSHPPWPQLHPASSTCTRLAPPRLSGSAGDSIIALAWCMVPSFFFVFEKMEASFLFFFFFLKMNGAKQVLPSNNPRLGQQHGGDAQFDERVGFFSISFRVQKKSKPLLINYSYSANTSGKNTSN